MKHRRAGRILGRKAHHRSALMKNLSGDLLLHRSLVTTAAKASELRRYVEPLITEAKQELSLHRRRSLRRKLRSNEDLSELLEVDGTQKERPGGYVRITRLPTQRSDGAPVVRVEIVE